MIHARFTVKYCTTMNETMTGPRPTPLSRRWMLLKAMMVPPRYAWPMAISRTSAGMAMRKMARKYGMNHCRP